MRCARIALVGLSLVAACGGGGGFDREAVVDQIHPDDVSDYLLDRAEEFCDDLDDPTYEWAVIGMHDSMDVTALAAQAIGCTDRYEPIANRYGWPSP